LPGPPQLNNVGFEVLNEVNYEEFYLLNKTPCSPVKVNQQETARLLPALCWFLFALFFDPEDGVDMFLRNVNSLLRYYTMS
jgi:hypothetical protein